MFIARVKAVRRSVREFLNLRFANPKRASAFLLMSVLWWHCDYDKWSATATPPRKMQSCRASLFAMLDALPLAGITSLIGMCWHVVLLDLVDPASLVSTPDHGRRQKSKHPCHSCVVGASFEGAVAIVLLLSAGGPQIVAGHG